MNSESADQPPQVRACGCITAVRASVDTGMRRFGSTRQRCRRHFVPHRRLEVAVAFDLQCQPPRRRSRAGMAMLLIARRRGANDSMRDRAVVVS